MYTACYLCYTRVSASVTMQYNLLRGQGAVMFLAVFGWAGRLTAGLAKSNASLPPGL